MSNTTVDSKKIEKRNNNAPACSQIIPTDKNQIEIPPKAHEFGVSYQEVKDGEGIIATAGNSKVREDGILECQDGTTIAMMNPRAYLTIKEYQEKQAEMKKLAEEKENAEKSELTEKAETR